MHPGDPATKHDETSMTAPYPPNEFEVTIRNVVRVLAPAYVLGEFGNGYALASFPGIRAVRKDYLHRLIARFGTDAVTRHGALLSRAMDAMVERIIEAEIAWFRAKAITILSLW